MIYEAVTSLSSQQMILYIGRPNAFVKMYLLYNSKQKYLKINLRIYLAYIYMYVSSLA